ncbi:DNA-binding transcriptional regulator Fis [Buchnera aphidicola]|uniref:DNA-binding protein Fis n=1 Tax=Buchnera aphidicola str. USDA (Myzus persicae) TaxID=1009856 RepID=W0NZT5_BUCMP|nr:DNA-binding transcriptional regulator Fis [Buchnera aphidicola]AHG59989.1 Fis [Buchnera aphidicola str. USDA (Myzus persicae)]AHG60569.1 Fis [Buchnera aphidicola str. W106 (Myzus persicae)]AHG61142.1 Fis [Buchnera aphidicola str. G002 (Myzus persicae)]AHG61714.1 Fis [Buchnera aphidicola str. F009 (Myzus persicae)]WAI03326.1 MAG: DNA-binding transcriptional regulator Fis [Buchnera aphidicola (Myzus persicae)]
MLEETLNTEFFVVSSISSQNKIIKKPLRESVRQSLKHFLLNLNGKNIDNLYSLALSELEQPLLDMIMQHTRGNQTRAALMMGINRSTLRKKLKKYGMN